MIQCIKVHMIAGEKMNTYRIAVCDDDPVMREQLHSFCRELLDGESIPYAITAFPSAEELEKRMNSDVEKPFNLLILDIQMNGMTGPPTIGPPPWMKSVKAGIWKFGITKAMPMARAPIVPILRKVER